MQPVETVNNITKHGSIIPNHIGLYSEAYFMV